MAFLVHEMILAGSGNERDEFELKIIGLELGLRIYEYVPRNRK